MNESNIPHQRSPAFPLTRWTVVLAAKAGHSPEADVALEKICRAYWYPLYAYIRRRGHSSHDAEDLTQEFFRRLLEKQWLSSIEREKGRLRTFLIVALRRFMVGEWRRTVSQRRGGGQKLVPMDTAFAESRYVVDLQTRLPPEESFDREWAVALHDLTLERLQNEFETAGKREEFEHLKDCLMASRGAIDYLSVAARTGKSEGAARVSVHRLRKRFREIYREEVSHTLAESEDVETELRYLAGVLMRT